MKSTLFVLASFITCFLFAQDIPEDRIIDWSQAGLHRPLNYSSVLNIDEFESFVESNGSYSIAVNEAIKSLAEKGGGVLKFNSKEYFFTQTINVPSNIVLSGISSRETIFKFNLAGKGACISFKGKVNGKALTFIKEAKFQSKEIYVSGDIAPNTYAFVRYKDKSVLESSWAYNHFGQLVFNTGQNNGAEQLESPLRLSISNLSIADVQPIKPVVNSGIENFTTLRSDKSSQKVANVLFDYAANSFMTGIESNKTNFAHVDIRHSSHISIKGNYFHHSFNYGSCYISGELKQYIKNAGMTDFIKIKLALL